MGLLDGKNALVCGVTNKSSIGWGIAKALHAQGARLAFTCVETNVRRLKRFVPGVDTDIIIPCDVLKDEDIESAAEILQNAFQGRLDILVHSIAHADISDLGSEFIQVSRSGWNLALEAGAYSLVALSRAFRPMLTASGCGSIITLTFVGGRNVVPGYNIMGIAKSALNMSVKYLAYDLGPDRIRVNAISAGPITTFSSMAVENFDTALQLVQTHSPLLRNISQEDLGGTAVYLASDLSRAVTGEILSVDSGMHLLAPTAIAHRRSPQKESDSQENAS
ncbi:MAG: SDR family oxidoreductase [Pseudomonadota bacterium]